MSGISTNRTNITLPTEVSAEILQKTQEQSAVMNLARQIALPGRGLSIPVIVGDPAAEWVAETGEKPVSNPSLSTKTMTPYKLAVIVPFSMEFRRDAKALYDALVQRLPLALAAKFDATVFHGTAPGSGFDTLAAVTGQTISGTGNSFYSGIVAADEAIATAGGILTGFAMSPQAKGEMLKAVDNNKRPLFINNVAEGAIPMLIGAPVNYAKAAYKAGDSNTPDVIGFAGDWTQAMYGTVEGVQITLSDQATLTYTENSQTVTLNLWQRNMFAVRAEIEVGFVADTSVFNKITRTHA
jgi:HK97 family phage major capsid protein